jgi:hypothetical protein
MPATKPDFTLSYQSRLPARRGNCDWVPAVIQGEGILLALPGMLWFLKGLTTVTSIHPATLGEWLAAGLTYVSPMILGMVQLIAGLGVRDGRPWAYLSSAILVSGVSIPFVILAMILLVRAANEGSWEMLALFSLPAGCLCFQGFLIMAMFHRQGRLKHHRA